MMNFLENHWSTLLDALSKGATIVAAIAIWVAYLQYRHSVRLAQMNERRAAVELAARECDRYGREIVELDKLVKKINESGCKYLEHCKVVKENDKEDQKLLVDSSAVAEEDKKKIDEYSSEIATRLNSLEGFAIPFACGVADDQVGFMECGRSFVQSFEKNFALYNFIDLRHYYKSSQMVYWRWRKQIEKEELERQHAQAGKEFFTLSEKLLRGEPNSWMAQKVATVLREAADCFTKPK